VSRYSRLWEHFLCYIIQTAPANVNKEEPETKTGVYFPLRQQIIINNIQEMLKTDCLNDKYTDKTEKDKELGKVLMYFC
jgi:hypothetical protein